MNIYDAAKILGLAGATNPQTTKQTYRTACKKYHPDINPAGEDMMKIINEAFETLKEFSGEFKSEQADYGDNLNEALNAILPLHGLFFEICGAWLWITGDTKTHKDALKEAGFKWASKKKAWYFRPEEFRSRSRGKASLDEIRTKYGSTQPQRKNYQLQGRNE